LTALANSFFPSPKVIRFERLSVATIRIRTNHQEKDMKSSSSSRLSDLVNIGNVTAELLIEVDISTPQELRAVGPAEAWRRIRARHPEKATLACLYALQGALLGIPWKVLPQVLQDGLLSQVEKDW
jgi:DNA transformation protein and related proteins